MSVNELHLRFLHDLKITHTANLRVYQLQEAQFGNLHCPPHIKNEIKDIREKIQNIEAEVEQILKGETDTGSRSKVKPDTLDKLVTEQLKHQVINKLEFTAYDITLALRRAHPNLDIHHQEVRRSVRLQLSLIVETGIYTRTITNYGNKTANRYIPTSKPT